jgi:hypothetical protein
MAISNIESLFRHPGDYYKVPKSALGFYEASDNTENADIVVAHSFGTLITETSINRILADLALNQANGRPIVADRMLVNAVPGADELFDLVVDGPITNLIGQGVGTYGVLEPTGVFMRERDLKLALMIAQARHIGRVMLQAKRLGIDSIAPANLPSEFEPGSTQWGTRSSTEWLIREVVGAPVLKYQKKL